MSNHINKNNNKNKNKNRTIEEIKESEKICCSIIENSPDFILRVNAKGEILYINRMQEGISKNDIFKKTIYDFIPSKDKQKVKEAIEIFKLNVGTYPQSANAYDSLGEAYLINGDTESAIANYKKSLELDPRNTNATEVLKKLGA